MMNSLVSVGIGCSGEKILGEAPQRSFVSGGPASTSCLDKDRLDRFQHGRAPAPSATSLSASAFPPRAVDITAWLRRLVAAVDERLNGAVDRAIECSEVGVNPIAAAESATGATLGRGSHQRAQATRQHFPGQKQRHASKGWVERTDSVRDAIGMPTSAVPSRGCGLVKNHRSKTSHQDRRPRQTMGIGLRGLLSFSAQDDQSQQNNGDSNANHSKHSDEPPLPMNFVSSACSCP